MEIDNEAFNFNITPEGILKEFVSRQLTYKETSKQILICCYVLVFLLAVVANILVIFVVLKFHYMRSITNYFLVNLSVADLLVTLICMPMAVGEAVTRLWLYGETMCKLTAYLQGVAVGASVFTITAMSVDRYLAIRHPMAFRQIFNRKSTLYMIVVLWAVSITIFSPLLWVKHIEYVDIIPGISQDRQPPFCTEKWQSPEHMKIFGVFCFVVVYAIPGVVIFLAYSLMGLKLCSSAAPFHGDKSLTSTEQGSRLVRERRRVARILMLLASLFALCWLPYNVLSLLFDLKYANHVEALSFALLLGHANSAINPIFYCLMTKNFRNTVKEVLFRSRGSLATRPHQKRKIRLQHRSRTSSSAQDSPNSQQRCHSCAHALTNPLHQRYPGANKGTHSTRCHSSALPVLAESPPTLQNSRHLGTAKSTRLVIALSKRRQNSTTQSEEQFL